MRVATHAPIRQISRRRATHAPYPDLVQPAEVAVHNERQRLARELHDSVAQTLYGITLNASRVLTLLERRETEQVHTIVNELLRLDGYHERGRTIDPPDTTWELPASGLPDLQPTSLRMGLL